jgi:hypothetical protein
MEVEMPFYPLGHPPSLPLKRDLSLLLPLPSIQPDIRLKNPWFLTSSARNQDLRHQLFSCLFLDRKAKIKN